MNEIINLDRLKVGQKAKIIEVNEECGAVTFRRIRELGIVKGSLIECYGEGIGGEPKSYKIKNTILALRKDDTKYITVEKFEEINLNIALAGNPNVGKSTIFNGLTGLKQHTGNWAGKTVTSAKGFYFHNGSKIDLIDIPGCYSVFSISKDEDVAREVIESENIDGVVVVCDGTCLERNLILVLQTLLIRENVILCVNLLDEAKKRNIDIDLGKLSELLGIHVIGTDGRRKKGLIELSDAILQSF